MEQRALLTTLYWCPGGTLGGGGAWDLTTPNWNTSSTGGQATQTRWINGDTAYFGNYNGSVGVVVNASVTAAGLVFGTGWYNLTGSPGIVSATSQFTVDVPSGQTDSLSTPVTGPSGVTLSKTDSGTLNIGSSNVFTGQTVVQAGKLVAWAQSATANVQVNSGATLSIISGMSGPLPVVNGTVTGPGTVVLNPCTPTHFQPVYVLALGGANFNVNGGGPLAEGSLMSINGEMYAMTYKYNNSTHTFGNGNCEALVGAYASNWSGYTIDAYPYNNCVQAVSGSWTVPAVQNSSVGTWVGIDGYRGSTDPTVEQIGTAWLSYNGSIAYHAWVEFYGDVGPQGQHGQYYYATVLPTVTVNAGDSISASVTFVSNTLSTATFAFSITDSTSRTSWSGQLTTSYVVPLRSSADWIVEDPLQNFVNFGTVSFSSATAQISGLTKPIDGFSFPYLSTPVSELGLSGGSLLAATLPSLVTDSGGSSSFSVTCPVYAQQNMALSTAGKTQRGMASAAILDLDRSQTNENRWGLHVRVNDLALLAYLE